MQLRGTILEIVIFLVRGVCQGHLFREIVFTFKEIFSLSEVSV